MVQPERDATPTYLEFAQYSSLFLSLDSSTLLRCDDQNSKIANLLATSSKLPPVERNLDKFGATDQAGELAGFEAPLSAGTLPVAQVN